MSAEQKKAVVKVSDMSEEMQADAVDVASSAMEKFSIEKDVAGITPFDDSASHKQAMAQLQYI